MTERRITRRSAVALGAATGAAAVAPGVLRPALAGASVGVVALTLTGSDLRGRVLRPGLRFGLVGLRGTGLGRASVAVRARRTGGSWGPWLSLHAGAHGPDASARPATTEPVWTGAADELQLRGTLRGGCQLILVADERPASRPQALARAAAVGVPTIIPRADWGAAAVPPRSAPSFGTVKLAFVHHTVNANTYSEQDEAAIVLAIARYHKNGNGWNDIGYNFLVDRFGRIYEGRAGGIDQAIIGAQAGGWNSVSTGVAIIGTFDAGDAPAAAMESVARLLAWKLPLHGVPVVGDLTLTSSGGSANRYRAGVSVTLQRISGHQDGSSTDCPGKALYGQLAQLRARTLALAGSGGLVPPATFTVAIDTPPASVSYGAGLVIGGIVRNENGSPVPGRAVAIEKQGTTRWVTIGRATTDADGRFSATVDWRLSGVVRCSVATDAGIAVSRSASVRAGAQLTSALKARHVQIGRRAVVSGSVTPATAVSVVVELQQRDKRYRRVGIVGATAGSGGAYRAAIPLKKGGLYRLTVTSTGKNGVDGATSAPLFVRAVRNVT